MLWQVPGIFWLQYRTDIRHIRTLRIITDEALLRTLTDSVKRRLFEFIQIAFTEQFSRETAKKVKTVSLKPPCCIINVFFKSRFGCTLRCLYSEYNRDTGPTNEE